MRIVRGSGDYQREAADQSHQDHRQADDVQDVDAEEVGPRGPSPGDDIFLEAEEESKGKNFGAAEGHGAGEGGGRQVLANEFVGDQSEGDSRQKKKERSGQGAEELRSFDEGAVAGVAAEPGVVAVGL